MTTKTLVIKLDDGNDSYSMLSETVYVNDEERIETLLRDNIHCNEHVRTVFRERMEKGILDSVKKDGFLGESYVDIPHVGFTISATDVMYGLMYYFENNVCGGDALFNAYVNSKAIPEIMYCLDRGIEYRVSGTSTHTLAGGGYSTTSVSIRLIEEE